ncbi:MAG: hypothetical protein HY554_03865 [Elusimicrobia bacterium]|nr:hypothetical protein [Elusimicrobiota bacterium]
MVNNLAIAALALSAALWSGCAPSRASGPARASQGGRGEAGAGLRLRVGVVEFENKAPYARGTLGAAAADVLVTELAASKRFVLIERQRLAKVLEEQKLGLSDLVEADTAARMGRLLGLNAIVTGSITSFGVSQTGTDYLVAQRKNQRASAVVDVRVVDAETGRVLSAESGQGQATLSTSEFLGMGSRAGYAETLEGEALRAAIRQLAGKLASQVDAQDWSCRVAELEGAQVYLDAGSESGLAIGDRLKAYRQGREVRGAKGQLLGRTQEEIGELEIVEFFGDNGAIARVAAGKAPARGDLVKRPR